MKILYGVTGEGLGHTMRARALAEELTAQGHTVCLAASSRAAPILRGHGFETIAIDGFRLAYRRGAVERARTLASLAYSAPHAIRRNVEAALVDARAFRPDAVITDFDSFSYLVGWLHDVPIVSFDHQHVVDRCRHPRDVLKRVSRDFRATRAIVRAKTPGCSHFVVSSFFFPPVRVEKSASTTLVGPVLRREIVDARRERGDHVIVYQTSNGDPRLLPSLLANDRIRFRVYGAGPARTSGHVELRDFDERSFIEDLATARGVIANGGFTTIAEALYLGKPILSVPIRHQGEQELNAAWLEALGYGMRARRIDGVVVRAFVERIEERASEPALDARLTTGRADAFRAVHRALAEAA